MSRYRVMAGPALLLLTSCASAGDGADQPPVDAPRPDAPRPDAPVDMCPSAATCPTAISLGQVSGDTGNQKLMAMGYQSAWFQVRVSEDYSGPDGVKLRLGARLTSPASADYDVFLYINTGADVLDCTNTFGTPTTTGTVNEVRIQWGEGTFSNGSNDDRTVSIEVRPISTGKCTPAQMWQLEVEGNWN